MIHLYRLAALLLACAYAGSAAAQYTEDFEQSALPLDTFARATGTAPDTLLVFPHATFPSSYDTTFGFWTGGWALSTSRNDSIGDFSNLYGAAAGMGADGSATYLVGQQDASVLLMPGTRVLDFAYSNLAYTVEALTSGTQFSRAFGVDTAGMAGFPDSLMLSVCGYENGNPTYVGNFALADFRGDDASDYILSDWARASALGDSLGFLADSLSFRLLSSDAGAFGNNTPNFFVLDNLTLRVPALPVRNARGWAALSVYPNPTSDYLRLEFEGPLAHVALVNAHGQVVWQRSDVASSTLLDVSQLASGQYVLIAHVDARWARAQVTVQ